MSCRIAAVLGLVLAAHGIAAEPLSPEKSRDSFRIAPGVRIDLVASEPQIESPVAANFDERGRLWVVEMRDYPNGPANGEKPGGRIKILTDNDGDGRFETATVFADGLLFANGVLPWKDGAIVTAAPQILFLRDTDGDGKCDVREVLYEGFVAGNPQLRVSHPILGMDGWIYVANGLRGGEIRNGRKKDAPAIPIGGKDFRFDPVLDRAEAIPGMGQFGNTFDRWGNRFVCDNRNHLRHVVFAVDPAARNPHLPAKPLVEDTAGPSDGPLSSGTKVYPLSKNWTTSNLHAGRFTASCGAFVDQGGLLPEPLAGAAFTCEPTGNLVHAEILSPHGATFKSRPWKDGVEFLATTDEWFRPVSLTQAPDGSLILVDMYRAVIEHPEFMPPELKNRPDLTLGRERGRIWRIAPETSKPAKMSPDLGKLGTAEWVKLLGHANGWQRTTAQRLLLTGNDPKTSELVETYARTTDSPDGLIRAAWFLARSGPLPAKVRERLLKQADPAVLEQVARLLSSELPTAEELQRFAVCDNARVRFQCAVALGEVAGDSAVSQLAAIGSWDAADRWTRLAVASSSHDRAGTVVAAVLARNGEPTEGRLALIRELSELVGSRRNDAEVAGLVAVLGKQDAPWQRAGLSGLADGVSRRGTSFPEYLATLPDAKAILALLAAATKPATDAKAPETERIAAVQLLSHSPWKAAGPVLTELLESDDTPPPIRVAAIRSVAAHSEKGVPALLLKGWRGYTPALRSDVLEALISRPERVATLLDAIETGRLKPSEVDPLRARRLVASKDPKLAARAAQLLKDSLPADRKDVLAKYRDALKLTGDAARGREVFKANCAVCHAVAGIGVGVGPDISDTRTKTAEMLLSDILSPNAAIDGNFISYTVSTKDGKSFSGIIAAESSASIALKRDGNTNETILRADIDELKSSGLSLMPDGLEKSITVPQMADLIRFLKDWRYLETKP